MSSLERSFYICEMPVVLTVICRCFNHASFLEEAIASVFAQEQVKKQVIFVDDGSEDGSRALAESLKKKYLFDKMILHEKNIGNTKSFNHALKYAEGEFVIDFSCDDVFEVNAFFEQMACFKEHPDAGMLYSNASFINEKGETTGYHYPINNFGQATEEVPSGDVFFEVLKSSLDKVLIAKRLHKTNSSRNFMSVKGRAYYQSTALIFENIAPKLFSSVEKKALSDRCAYEGRNALFWGFKEEQIRFKKIMQSFELFDLKTILNWQLYRFLGAVLRNLISKS